MSKARLIITAVVLEGRSQAEVARDYGVSEGWVSELVARYRAEGDAAFEPRSRRPHTLTRRDRPATVDLIVELRADARRAGSRRRRRHDRLAPRTPPPDPGVDARRSTGYLRAAGLDHPRTEEATASRPTSASKPSNPTRRWQADFTHYRLADGTDIEILTWLDDHSRYALSVTAHRRVTGPIVVEPPSATPCENHGIPSRP